MCFSDQSRWTSTGRLKRASPTEMSTPSKLSTKHDVASQVVNTVTEEETIGRRASRRCASVSGILSLTACAQGSPTRWDLEQSAPRRVAVSFTGRPRLQRQQRACRGPGQAGAGNIRFLFEAFRRTASACAVVKAFRQKRLLFPRRLKKGRTKVTWFGLNCPTAGHHSAQSAFIRAHSFSAAVGLATTRMEVTSYTKLPPE
jgi:hypothetical protein